MKKIIILLLSLLFCVNHLFAQEQSDKNRLSDDVVLSMPCGVSMVFRKVYTSYSQEEIQYFIFEDGLKDTEKLKSEGPFKCYVRGDFFDKKGSYYLISKYELMEYQYQALKNYLNFGDKCKPVEINKKNRIPQVNITYKDASDITEVYSNYLQKKDETPFVIDKNGKKHKAIAKICSGCEWSFAARGGREVTKEQLESKFPYLGESSNIKDYAWLSGADSSNGKLQITGLKNRTLWAYMISLVMLRK